MKHLKNDILNLCCGDIDVMNDSFTKLCSLIREHPFLLNPVRGANKRLESIFATAGFKFYPTVKKTTLLYEEKTDHFFKIIHPLTFKNKTVFYLVDKAGTIHNNTGHLASSGIKISKLTAYGTFKKGRRPLLIIKRIEGESLHESLIKQRKTLSLETYINVMDEVAKVHRLGYWFGDAQLSHIFIKDRNVSGFIDVDSIRKNRPYMLKNFAKDIAGLNHPALLLTTEEKKLLLNYYLKKLGIKNENRFLKLLKHYTKRRWGQDVS